VCAMLFVYICDAIIVDKSFISIALYLLHVCKHMPVFTALYYRFVNAKEVVFFGRLFCLSVVLQAPPPKNGQFF